MKEIIVAGFGNCGINLTASYLSQISNEHSIDASSDSITPFASVHFNETSSNITARFLFVDNDPLPLDRILSHPLSSLISPKNLISGRCSSSNVFSLGCESSKIYEEIIDAFRKEIEKCECCQGIIVNHSSMGGTGSGLVARIMPKIYYSFSPKIIINNLIVPSFHEDDAEFLDNHTSLSIINTLLLINELIDSSNMTITSDNDALSQNAESLGWQSKDYQGLNMCNGKVISGLTSGSRFQGLQPFNLLKSLTNCVPFPKMHFFSGHYFEESSCPVPFLQEVRDKVKNNSGGSHLTFSQFSNYIIASAGFIRGNRFSSSEIEEFNLNPLTNHYEWIPQGAIGHTFLPEKEYKSKAVFFNIGRFNADYLRKLSENYNKIFRRLGFIHHYRNAGIEKQSMETAEINVNDLVSEIMFNLGNAADPTEIGEYDDDTEV